MTLHELDARPTESVATARDGSAPRLLVIILNYQTPQLTMNCLQSVAAQVENGARAAAVVVDNGSGDGSTALIRSAIQAANWAEWAAVIPLVHNRGYAAGNNAAIREAMQSPHPPEYFLLLNSDTIVRPGAIRALLEFMHDHPHVGIAGSRLEDANGNPQCSAFRFPTVLSEFDGGLRLGTVSRLLSRWVLAPALSAVARPTDWVAGACMLVRRAVFASVGLFDEKYFLYFEDVDFCLRARQAGWPCWYVPAGRVVHLVGQSTGIRATEQVSRLPDYWFCARRRYFLKHHGRLYTTLADVAWLTGFALWRARRCLQRKPDQDPPYLFRDFLRHTLLRNGDHV